MPYADVSDQRIHFEDPGGSGPPVILGHGLLTDPTMSAPQVAGLAGEDRVVTGDERGVGRTEHDGMPFTYWDSAADCLGLLDHPGSDRAPTRVVHGTEDHAMEMGRAEALAAGLPGCDGVVRVAGAQAANLTNPVPVNAAIGALLAAWPA